MVPHDMDNEVPVIFLASVLVSAVPLSSLISWRIVTCHPNTTSHITTSWSLTNKGLQILFTSINITLYEFWISLETIKSPITLLTSHHRQSMSKILLLGASQSNNPILLTQPSRTSLSDYKVFDMRLLRLLNETKYFRIQRFDEIFLKHDRESWLSEPERDIEIWKMNNFVLK